MTAYANEFKFEESIKAEKAARGRPQARHKGKNTTFISMGTRTEAPALRNQVLARDLVLGSMRSADSRAELPPSRLLLPLHPGHSRE